MAKKKKQSPKEKRELEKQKNSQHWRNKAAEEAARKQEELARAAEAKARQEMNAHWSQEKKDASEKNKKTRTKAAGLKSIFTIPGERLVMTSFQKGNSARPEVRVVNDIAEPLACPPPVFQVEVKESVTGKKQFLIHGSNFLDAQMDDPRAGSDKGDLIGCKSELERHFFGKEFEDNIHIQVIYNILDVEKTLAVYMNSIIYALNNVLNRENPNFEERIDLLKSTSSDNYQQLIGKPQLVYFSSVFYEKNDEGKYKPRSDEAIFAILRLLAKTRMSVGHFRSKGQGQNTFIYRLDELTQREIEILDQFYDSRVEELNRNFDKLAKTDLTILFRALKALDRKTKAEIAQMYYDFVVRKTQNNLGFSVKRLREIFLTFHDAVDEDRKMLTGMKYDTVRHKLYKAIDFIVNRYYQNHPDQAAAMVERLRTEPQSKKGEVYEKEAHSLWKSIRDVVLNGIVPQIRDIKKVIKSPDPETIGLVSDTISSENTSRFSKLLYLLTMFLDGKEINELLCTLINKFRNIDAFLSVLDELQRLEGSETEDFTADFTRGYGLFCQSGKIAQELSVIRSFARMQKPDANAKRIMFVEAAQLLGSDMDAEQLTAYFDGILGNSKDSAKDSGFWNFIINNVIKSSRFQYLIRYVGPLHARRLANNKAVIRFVLNELPESQIHRYYDSCREDSEVLLSEEDMSGRREALAKKITGLQFEHFQGVHQGNDGSAKQKEDKQRKRAIIGLYLTVLYLLTKNLVNVNARYFMAFHACERDQAMKYPKEKGMTYVQFGEEAMSSARMNRRARSYLAQNLENAHKIGNFIVSQYRNQVAHLNAVRLADRYIGDIREIESYYALYHYIMQRLLMEECKMKDAEVSELLKKYFTSVCNYRTYCKDLVKALNAPFCYNLPRYKNLSIDGLFDRNRPRQREENNLSGGGEWDSAGKQLKAAANRMELRDGGDFDPKDVN